jgi:N utilization substance protein A
MINQDFFNALIDLEREKGISQEAFISALEDALVIAYKKATGETGGVEVKLNADKKSIKL